MPAWSVVAWSATFCQAAWSSVPPTQNDQVRSALSADPELSAPPLPSLPPHAATAVSARADRVAIAQRRARAGVRVHPDLQGNWYLENEVIHPIYMTNS